MRWAIALLLYVAAILCLGWYSINLRVCDQGLPTCNLGLIPPKHPASYVAARALLANDRLTDSDLEPPSSLSPAAERLLPPRSDFVGRYVRVSVPKGRPLIASNLGDSPAISNSDQRCLTAAEAGSYSLDPGLLRPGQRVQLACKWINAGVCSGAGEWTLVALIKSNDAADGLRVLATADPARCADPAPLVVAGLSAVNPLHP